MTAAAQPAQAQADDQSTADVADLAAGSPSIQELDQEHGTGPRDTALDDGSAVIELVEASPADVLDPDSGRAGGADDREGQLVDQGVAALGPATLVARPVLPAWCASRAEFVDAAGWAARHAAHVTAFHALRLPLYWCRLATRSPVGMARLIAGLWRWTTDAAGHAVRAGMAGSGVDPRDFIRVTQQRREIVRGRLAITAALVVGLAFTGWAVLLTAPPAALVASSAALLALLGVRWSGRGSAGHLPRRGFGNGAAVDG
ncbi:MAG TPA: hypothetical protein VFP89_15110 [Propionibacteriaceae bacterium]|nr:hypothetical protein [Propionibacteriaceae bacterium]